MNQPSKICYCLIGCAGAGKSFLAYQITNFFRQLNYSVAWLSTDDFFKQNAVGEYRFTYKDINKAHKWNRDKFAHCIKDGVDVVIVDNTNTQAKWFSYYENLATDNGYIVKFVEPDTWWRYNPVECSKRNSHGVDLTICERMIDSINKTLYKLGDMNITTLKGIEQVIYDVYPSLIFGFN